MSVNISVTLRSGAIQNVSSDPGHILMGSVRAACIVERKALCGGGCSRATCHVDVDPEVAALLPPADQEALAASIRHSKRFGRPDEYAMLAVSSIECPYLNGEEVRLNSAIRTGVR